MTFPNPSRAYPSPTWTTTTYTTTPAGVAPQAKPLLSQAEREAFARFGESMRVASHGIADGLASLSEAIIRAGEDFAIFTATVKAQEDE